MPKPARYQVQHIHKPLNSTSLKFAEAYARDQHLVRAAISAGISRHIAISAGTSLLSDARVGTIIAAHMRARDPEAADEFEAEWGLAEDEEEEEAEPSLFDRIAAARETLALESRNGLPEPAELIFTRKPISRRSRRAAQPAKDA